MWHTYICGLGVFLGLGHASEQSPAIVGILTQPSRFLADVDVSYAALSYAKWMDAMGVRCIPIVYTDPDEEIDCRLAHVHAVILPGGSRGTDARHGFPRFEYVAQRIITYAIDAAKSGRYLHIFGVCMGFQLLLNMTAEQGGNNVLLPGFDSGERPGPLTWTPAASNSSLFGDGPDQPLAGAIRERMAQSPPVVFYNHEYGVTLDTFSDNPTLQQLWTVLSTSEDRNGRRYISTAETKHDVGIPFLAGVQWHPEKTPFEWTQGIPHSEEALAVNRLVGRRIAALAAASPPRSGIDRAQLLQMLIWNEGSVAVDSPYAIFEEIFLFNERSRQRDGFSCSGVYPETPGLPDTPIGVFAALLLAACLSFHLCYRACSSSRLVAACPSIEHQPQVERRFGSVALAGGMLLFGSLQTVSSKIMYETVCPSLSSGAIPYNKPWLTLFFMFCGESVLLAPFLMQKVRRGLTDVSAPCSRASASVFVVPTICDMLGTGLALLAMMFIDAATWQMLRGALVVFAAILSNVVLGRKFDIAHWKGIAVSSLALLLIGLGCVWERSPAQQADAAKGVFLVVCAQFFTAIQNVTEEFAFKNHHASSSFVVGMEGLWGVGLTGAVLCVMTCLPGADNGVFQSMPEALHMIRGSGSLLACIIVYIIASGAFNFMGVQVCQRFGAVTRCFVDTMRIIVVWGTELSLYYGMSGRFGQPWTTFSDFKLFGFVLLIAGTCLYNGLSRKQVVHAASSLIKMVTGTGRREWDAVSRDANVGTSSLPARHEGSTASNANDAILLVSD